MILDDNKEQDTMPFNTPQLNYVYYGRELAEVYKQKPADFPGSPYPYMDKETTVYPLAMVRVSDDEAMTVVALETNGRMQLNHLNWQKEVSTWNCLGTIPGGVGNLDADRIRELYANSTERASHKGNLHYFTLLKTPRELSFERGMWAPTDNSLAKVPEDIFDPQNLRHAQLYRHVDFIATSQTVEGRGLLSREFPNVHGQDLNVFMQIKNPQPASKSIEIMQVHKQARQTRFTTTPPQTTQITTPTAQSNNEVLRIKP